MSNVQSLDQALKLPAHINSVFTSKTLI